MNGQPITQKPNIVQVISVVSCALIALTLAFAVMWCAIWKIYMDPIIIMMIGTVMGGVSSSLTMILVGRSIPQLNQSPDGKEVSQKINNEEKKG